MFTKFRFSLSLILVAILIFVGIDLHAGEIHGKILIREKQESSASIGTRSILRKYVTKTDSYHEHDSKAPDTLSVIVYLEGFEYTPDTTSSVAVLDQRGQKFVPHVLPVLVGTEVRFPNSDVVYHNVFSFSKPKNFDLGRYPTGKSKSVIFDKPGIVKVYCDIHPDMNAFIIVLQNPYFTTTAPDGSFKLTDIPAGSYKLKAWYGRWPEKSIDVTVTDEKPVYIDIDFP
jgi:plastocyanin